VENLNRSGFESYRNKAKAWRPQRIDKKTGKLHELDNMRLGAATEEHPTGRPVNTTGCFGVKTSGMQLRISNVIKKGAKGRDRPPRKRKNVSKLYTGNISMEFEKISKAQLFKLRSSIMTYKFMLEHANCRDKMSKELDNNLNDITKYLESSLSDSELKEMHRQDVHRYHSTKGMIKSGLSAKSLSNQNENIRRALTKLKIVSPD
jgi:hypothetical protein